MLACKEKKCEVCAKGKVKRSDSGTIDTHCLPRQKQVSGFESAYCNEFQDRQCTMCEFESGNYDRCNICLGLEGKIYFEAKKVR
jgi:hypothetical protein